MFKDTEKELKRLEDELLAETQRIPTDTDELLRQLHEELDPAPVTNSDQVDTDVEKFGQQVMAPAKENLTGLVVAALLLTAGILVLAAWWVVRLFG